MLSNLGAEWWFRVGIFATGATTSGMVSCDLFLASSNSLGFQVAGPSWKLGSISEERKSESSINKSSISDSDNDKFDEGMGYADSG